MTTRSVAILITLFLLVPAVLVAEDQITSEVVLVVVEGGESTSVSQGAVACAAIETCSGDGCTPVPAFKLTVTAGTLALDLTLADPAPAGSSHAATPVGQTPIAGMARVAVVTSGSSWTVTGGTILVERNELPTSNNHLRVKLTDVTDGTRTLSGNIYCFNRPPTQPPDGDEDGESGGC